MRRSTRHIDVIARLFNEAIARSHVRAEANYKLYGAVFGVFHGVISARLLRAIPDMTLYMVDDWSPPDLLTETKRRAAMRELAAYQQQAMNATAFAESRRRVLRMKSFVAAPLIGDGTLAAVFLRDTGISTTDYNIPLLWPKIRAGGVLSGDGFTPACPDIRRAVTEWATSVHMEIKTEGFIWWIEKHG